MGRFSISHPSCCAGAFLFPVLLLRAGITWLQLDRQYERLTRQLVRMIATAEEWIPGRASGRTAGAARDTPTPPRPQAGKEEPEEAPARKEAGNSPPLARKKPRNERTPGKKAPG